MAIRGAITIRDTCAEGTKNSIMAVDDANLKGTNMAKDSMLFFVGIHDGEYNCANLLRKPS